MSTGDAGEVSGNKRRSRRGLWLGIIITFTLMFIALAIIWWINNPAAPTEAPEAEVV
jgi:uncharacterized membrane protein YdbT with pleckstrin-like domain